MSAETTNHANHANQASSGGGDADPDKHSKLGIPTAKQLLKAFEAFKADNAWLTGLAETPEQDVAPPSNSALLEMCQETFDQAQDILGEFAQQPYFVVFDVRSNNTATMFGCFQAGAHVSEELFFQGKAGTKMRSQPAVQRFYYRLARFADCEFLVTPLVALRLRSLGHTVKCCDMQVHSSSLLPLLQMFQSPKHQSSRVVQMTSMLDTTTGIKSSLGLAFPGRKVDLVTLFATQNNSELLRDNNGEIIRHRAVSGSADVDAVLALFLWWFKIPDLDQKVHFMSSVRRILT
jgi:hypothetical protein